MTNGGKDYVEDAEALAAWGRPDGAGGKAHVFGTKIFEDCEDAGELLELTRAALDGAKEPKVSYECSVIDLAAMGFDYEGVSVGDTVAIVDSAFTPTLRATARVMAMKRDLLKGGLAEITIGNIRPHLGTEAAALAGKLNAISRRSASWDVAAATPSDYINRIIDGLNREFDAGASYVFQSPEQGIIVASVPLDPESGKPTTTPASAIQLKGGGFRIANAVAADGSFAWRTFGTGDGFTADEVTAGIIKGGSNWWNLSTGDLLFKQGSISDASGKNSWNLSSGYLATTKGLIGGLSIESGYIGNSVFRLNSSGVHFYYSDYEVGKIGTNSYSGDSAKRGLVFDLEHDGAYMTWACKDSASADTYTMKLSYVNQAFGGFTADTLALGCVLDGRGFVNKNFWIDPNTGGANGGVTGTLKGMLPTSINSSGAVTNWTNNVYLQFKGGMLVKMYS